jgi:tetratricopeptide (TPR) repeat protein/tRNA A-37 threonylcarbamoyl transferase component Bud32
MESTSPSETQGSEATPSESLSERLGKLPQGAPRLDRYVLLEQTGRGSFAAVWSAYDPQLDRKVAIKILRLRERADVDSEQQRLLDEAQMLARLSHPNVVAIHDVRPLDDAALGRGLFIVMEHLAGPTLAAWMNVESPRPWREVVEVFVQAGRGLHAAHTQGLVHRDFKPSNVMFGADQRVRVLDFGLALPLREPENGEATTTGKDKHRLAGTPVYMAPEQHAGQVADARSDQFSFAIALYEALYGTRPFAGSGHPTLGRAKSQKQIQPPPRGTKVPAHVHAVVERALSPAPDDRFPNVAALLDQLERDPALERRRWLVFGVFALALGGSGYGLARMQQAPDGPTCEPPSEAFVGVWDPTIRAEIDGRFAGRSPWIDESRPRVAGRLDQWTLDWQTSYREGCEAELAREPNASFDADDPVRRCLERGLRRVAGLTGTLREADETSFGRAVEAAAALPQPSRCLAIDPPTVVDGSEERRQAILELETDIARAESLSSLGHDQEAIALAEPAIQRAIELGDPIGEARAGLVVGGAHFHRGENELAVAVDNRALAAAFRANDPREIVRALIHLLAAHDAAGHGQAAAALAEVAEDYLDRDLHDPVLAVDLDLASGRMMYRADDWVHARERLNAALTSATALFGDDHPKLASIETMLGIVASHETGDPHDSLGHFERALAIRVRAFGDHHPRTAEALSNRALTFQQLGWLDRAEADFRRAKEVLAAIHGEDHLNVIPVRLPLADLDILRGRLREALQEYDEIVPIAEAGWGPTHSWMTQIYPARARLLTRLGEHERAVADQRRSLAAHEQVYGASNPDTALGQAMLAEALREQAATLEPEAARGLLDEADMLERLASDQWARELPRDVGLRGAALEQKVRIALVRGRPSDALVEAERLLAFVDESHAAADDRAIAIAWLAKALLALDRDAEAIDRIDALLQSDTAAVGVDTLAELERLHASAESGP